MNYVVKNIENVNNSSNEVITRHTINRNFEKLLKNDIALSELANSTDSNKIGIKGWQEGMSYDLDDIVWFTEENRIFLLRSNIQNNDNRPQRTLYNKKLSFEPSGWRDMYEFGTLVNDIEVQDISISSDNDIVKYVLETFNKNIESYHVLDYSKHKYGELTDEKEQVDEKLLLKDLSNVDTARKTNFYPYETVNLKPDNTIMNGFYRKWDNGILEYDVIFRLGYYGEKTTINGTEYMVLSANVLSVQDDQIFLNEESEDIFRNSGDETIQINDTYQVNMNTTCNVFSQKIVLPEPFKDTNYSIFTSDVASQRRTSQDNTIDSGMNTIMFTDRKNNELTPVYIIYPREEQNGKMGLVSNSFHCQIVGRWR